MNMNFQNWTMNSQFYPHQDDYNNFQSYPVQDNFYFEQATQLPQSHYNLQATGYGQLNQQHSYFMEYQQPVELTTTRSRKRGSVSKSLKRQRQLRRNERERERQARLNSAFDVLRGSIPAFLAPYKNEQKLTQIETLRLAKYYISSLKGMLDECDIESGDSESECQDEGDNKQLRLSSSSSSEESSS